METNSEYTLELEGLSVGYMHDKQEVPVLNALNMAVRKSETVALLGLNGSGKSTLLRTLVRLQDVLTGQVRLMGQELSVWTRRDLARLLSFVSTEIVTSNNLSVFDLVALGRFPYTNWSGRLTADDKQIVDQAIRSVEIHHLSEKKISELSDGEKQRAMIARALAQDTPLVVLDEPTAFLDLPHKYEIFRLLQNLSAEQGKSIVMAIHDIRIAMQEADKVWLVNAGHIVDGSPEDLVLSGQIQRVFGSGNTVFDIGTGDFFVPRKKRGRIYLEGHGDAYTWTKKGLSRLGYQVSCNKSDELHVAINQRENELMWEMNNKGEISKYKSLYDLSLALT